jgi:hypothetical protein
VPEDPRPTGTADRPIQNEASRPKDIVWVAPIGKSVAGSAGSLALYAIKKLASPLKVFAMAKAGMLRAFSLVLLSVKLVAHRGPDHQDLEFLIAEPSLAQTGIACGLTVIMLGADHYLFIRYRQEAERRRDKWIAILKDPDMSEQVKARAAEQIFED